MARLNNQAAHAQGASAVWFRWAQDYTLETKPVVSQSSHADCKEKAH